MKLFKSFLSSHSVLLKDIAVSACLIGGTASVVFGISAGTFAIRYIDLQNAEKRWAAHNDPMVNYYSEKIESKWNMEERNIGGGKKIEGVTAPEWKEWTDNPGIERFNGATGKKEFFINLHPGLKDLGDNDWDAPWDKYLDLKLNKQFEEDIDANTKRARYAFNSMVVDGATHTSMDRSFNQSMYTGLVDFNQNKIVGKVDPDSKTDAGKYNVARTFKPIQDNTTSFVEVYKSALVNHNLVALAGFNHTTPLNDLMVHKEISKNILSGTVSNSNSLIDKQINQTAFVLVDANCPNNQNVASSIFRADQSGFLSSVATCQYFYNNLQMYHNHYQNIAVSMYGGVAIPAVVNYMGGYQRGIEFFNEFILNSIIKIGGEKYFKSPTDESVHLESFNNLVNYSKYRDDIKVLKEKYTPDQAWEVFVKEYKNKFIKEYSIKIIKLGGVETYFTGGFAIGDAIGISKQLLNRGASAIICVAGPEACDTAQEIVNQNSKCIVIGVDTPLEDSDYQRYHSGCGPKTRTTPNFNDRYYDHTIGADGSYSAETNSIIKFSAVKDIRSVTQKISFLCASGKNWDVSDKNDPKKPDPTKAICGPGFQTCCNILNGLISISWDGFVPLMQALQHIIFNGEHPSFDEAWDDAIEQYIEDIGESEWNKINEKYRFGVSDIRNLMSFKKVDESGTFTPYYECYNHTIQILGRLLSDKNKTLHFTPNMSLWHDAEGEIIPMPSTGENMTISEWLDTNMYLYT